MWNLSYESYETCPDPNNDSLFQHCLTTGSLVAFINALGEPYKVAMMVQAQDNRSMISVVCMYDGISQFTPNTSFKLKPSRSLHTICNVYGRFNFFGLNLYDEIIISSNSC